MHSGSGSELDACMLSGSGQQEKQQQKNWIVLAQQQQGGSGTAVGRNRSACWSCAVDGKTQRVAGQSDAVHLLTGTLSDRCS